MAFLYAVYLNDEQAINNASSMAELYPFIEKLMAVDELQTLLLSKYKSKSPIRSHVNDSTDSNIIKEKEQETKKKKVGGITSPKQQQKLKKFREQKIQQRQELDLFLLQNDLSNIFKNDTFFDNHITLDIIKYDNNSLNYTINDVADIICNDGNDTKTNCSIFDKLRLISSIAKIRNIDKINFNQAKSSEIRVNLIHKDDINRLKLAIESQQEINQFIIMIRNIINNFENTFENEMKNINQTINTVINDLDYRRNILNTEIIQWKINKFQEIEDSINDITKNNDDLQKLLNESYELSFDKFTDIDTFILNIDNTMSLINDIASSIEFEIVNDNFLQNDIISCINNLGAFKATNGKIVPVIQLLSEKVDIIDINTKNKTFSMSYFGNIIIVNLMKLIIKMIRKYVIKLIFI